MRLISTTIFFFCLVTAVHGQWVRQSVDTTASFRGLAVVSRETVWASGTGGTVIRTSDGGASWTVIKVPGAEKLDFRDIEAFDDRTAYVLSIGPGETSRIYKTTDGGSTWKEQFRNADPKMFFDAMACWDRDNCVVMSDPVEGHYPIFRTTNGGANWDRVISDRMPASKDGEAAFAASGTCLYIAPGGTLYLVSGGKDARVFSSTDRGTTWSVTNTPIVRGPAGAGIFSIAFRTPLHGLAVGGDYEKPNNAANNVAYTSDGGKTWNEGPGVSGYRSAVAFIDDRTAVAVGTNGTDLSRDRGRSWKKIGNEDLNAVAAKGKNAVWAVGPKGGVYKLKKL